MTPKLTAEQREAIRQRQGDAPVRVEDDETNQSYFLVDASVVESLQREQDVAAIREGIEDIRAGRVLPLDEAIARIRENLGLPLQP